MMGKKAELVNKQLESMDKKKAQDAAAEEIAGKAWQAAGRAVGLGSTTSSIIGQLFTPTMLGDGDLHSPAEQKEINDRAKQNSQSSSMWTQSDIGTVKFELAASLHHSQGFKK